MVRFHLPKVGAEFSFPPQTSPQSQPDPMTGVETTLTIGEARILTMVKISSEDQKAVSLRVDRREALVYIWIREEKDMVG